MGALGHLFYYKYLCSLNRIEMNYLKHYCKLIRKAENRIPPNGYTEKHHTFPKSIFGVNNRLVILTAREHYIAHLLLYKLFKLRYGIDNYKTKKMFNALWLMCIMRKNFNSHIYENLRIKSAEFIIGDNNPAKTPEARLKISEFMYSLGENHPMKQEHNRKRQSEMMSLNNPSKTLEVKDKLRQKMLGNQFSFGRIYTTEQKELMSTQRCKRTYKLISPTGEIIITKKLKDMKEKYNLDHSCLLKVSKGILGGHKGWKVEIL